MIPSYNCADLLRVALTSVLDQDPGPEIMQIEVIDDCSNDDRPEDVVREVGGERVVFTRQPHNVGIAANLTSCLTRSRGEWVHVLHGDDVAYDGLYARVGKLLAGHADVGAVVVGAEDIDEQGAVIKANVPLRPSRQILDDFEQGIFSWNPVRAPSVLARRSTYEDIGGFHPDLRYCADWDMWKRMAAGTCLLYEPDVLVGYRVHHSSDTAKLGTSVLQLREMIQALRIAHRYLPDGRTRAWSRGFYATTRLWALDMLRSPTRPLSAKDRAGYAGVIAECTLRSLADRVMYRSAHRREPS